MSPLDWMEQTSLGIWVRESDHGYYVVLAFHAIGLAILVGAAYVVCLRLLGRVREIELAALDKFVAVGMIGFLVNMLSGIPLFFSEANKAFANPTFLTKMGLMFLALIALLVMRRTALQHVNEWPGSVVPRSAKVQAAIVMFLWTATIITGRLTAYIGPGK